MSPVHPLRFYSFWAIDAPLDEARLCRQLDDMKAAGLDGTVFHPRFYPNQPPYLSQAYLRILSAAILYAKSIGLAFWLYDENGWPSGLADGKLAAQYPDDLCQRLELVPQAGPATLLSFAADGRQWHLEPRRIHGIDCLDPEACRHFLALTHDVYRQGLDPAAFAHVSAIFADEPEFGLSWGDLPVYGAIPWSRHLPGWLTQRFGSGWREQLPLLFFPGDGCREFRVAFWELVTDLIGEGFFAPCDDWCKAAGTRFTAHVKGEEHPLFQVPMVGSCQRVFRHIGLPGIDALERHPANDFYPRQVATVAQQFGDGRCMVEAFGGSGWGASPEDLERYLLWLAGHGLTDFVMHLWQYRLDTPAIRDWPPSQAAHLSWREAYPAVLASVRRRIAAAPPPPADTLVVAPYRGIMQEYVPQELLTTNIHNAATYPNTPAGRLNRAFLALVQRVHAAGLAYHLADERTLELDGRVEPGALAIGAGCYRRVILDEGCAVNAAGRRLLEAAGAAGVAVERGFAGGVLLAPPATGALRHELASVSPPAAPHAPIAHRLDIPPVWRLAAAPSNHLPLEPDDLDGRWHVCRFELRGRGHGRLEADFADDLAEATFDGRPLTLTPLPDGCRAELPWPAPGVAGELRFRTLRDLVRPCVWLRGDFRVFSLTPWTAGPNRTLRSPGPFVVEAGPSPGLVADLTAAGYPFLGEPILLEADLDIPPAAGSSLALRQLQAQAARVTLDGRDLGWCWGPSWQVALPEPLAPGRRRLRLELVPSTFNSHGPHHHYEGDRHVVSPGQYTDQPNFADSPGAPACTAVPDWHVRPLTAPALIGLG